MLEQVKKSLTSQYEASLCMLRDCIEACRDEFYDGFIAQGTFRYIAYHTLFFTDLYLTPSEDQFALRDVHQKGGDERGEELSPGVAKLELLPYLEVCHEKAPEVVASETEQTLAGPSGFSWRKCSRLELHIYNIRHVQHHTGQLSAYLRRVDASIGHRRDVLKWIGWGWRPST
jgi:uncharacterized damage-inducible protein DinB